MIPYTVGWSPLLLLVVAVACFLCSRRRQPPRVGRSSRDSRVAVTALPARRGLRRVVGVGAASTPPGSSSSNSVLQQGWRPRRPELHLERLREQTRGLATAAFEIARASGRAGSGRHWLEVLDRLDGYDETYLSAIATSALREIDRWNELVDAETIG